MPHVHILLERVDPTQNMARYYVLSLEPTLFGDSALVRERGRIGTAGQHRSDLFRETGEAQVALENWLSKKRRRGYKQRPKQTQNIW